MSLLSSMPVTDESNTPCFNTGTLWDIATGSYTNLSTDGEWYLDGGFGQHVNIIVGPNGNYKSTIMTAFGMRILGIYEGGEMIIEDTENSLDKDKERALNFAEELRSRIKEAYICWLKGVDHPLEELDAFLRNYFVKKMAVIKEYTVDTPFVDPKTMKPIKVIKPTIVEIDSLTELVSKIEEEVFDGEKAKGFDDPKTKLTYAEDGNKKTLFIRTMRRRCQKYGVILLLTGHYDKTMVMDMYNPNPKDTPFAPRDWKVKGCGSKIKFLSSIYARTQSAVITASDKTALYNDGSTPDRDLHEVNVFIERCKTSSAGMAVPFVASQTKGLLNTVTYYHYLRNNNYIGLVGNKQRHTVGMMPDVSITRNTIRQLADSDPKLRRALELTAQYVYIRNNWNAAKRPVPMDLDPDKLFEKLNSDKHKALKDDILNSRGWWTYDKKEPQPYMSLYRVIEHLQGLE